MDVLPDFELIRPTTLDEVIAARRRHPRSRLLGGGTDLLVNIRRGIGDPPPALIDVNGVRELQAIEVGPETLRIGAATRIAEIAGHGAIAAQYPVIAEAAGSIAGPTQRRMGTLGGNLCLDTRCIYYNQSEWWRGANDYCLKYEGRMCHVAPKSKVCFATYSGDLAPAIMIHGGTVEIVGPEGRRQLPLAGLYSGDGQNYLKLATGEMVAAVEVPRRPGLVTAYDKMRVRRSIDYPLAGVAVGLRREGEALAELSIAVTGTNPRPVLLDGTAGLCGGPLNDAVLDGIDELMRDQIMAMKTTFTPGHYRRRVAGVVARRLVTRLFEAGAQDS